MSVKQTYTLQTVVQPTLIPRWPTVGRVAYSALSRLSAPVELLPRYTTADVVLEIGSTSRTCME